MTAADWRHLALPSLLWWLARSVSACCRGDEPDRLTAPRDWGALGVTISATCDPEAWMANGALTLSVTPNDPAAGPPPYDAECRPIADRTCASVCDCIVIYDGCGPIAVNRESRWTYWQSKSTQRSACGCSDNHCTTQKRFKPSIHELVCESGQCRVKTKP